MACVLHSAGYGFRILSGEICNARQKAGDSNCHGWNYHGWRLVFKFYTQSHREHAISTDLIPGNEGNQTTAIVSVEVVVHYQTVFDRELGTLSGEHSFRVPIDNDILLKRTSASVEPNLRHRSGWIGDYLAKRQRGEYGREIFKQYPDKDR